MQYSKYYRLGFFALLGVLAFILNISASRDWSPYLKQFNRLSKNSWSDYFAEFSLFQEPLFYLSAKLFGNWIGFAGFIFILTVTLLTIKLHYLQKLSVRPWLAVYIYLCLYLFLLEGTVLRVAFATALIIPALYYLLHENWWRSLFLWALATQIHFSATVFIVAVPLLFIPYSGFLLLLVMFVVSPILIVSQLSLFEYLSDFVGYFRSDYVDYGRDGIVESQNSSGMFLYFVGFFYSLVLISVGLIWEKLKVDAFMRVIAGICMLAVIVMCSLHDHVIAAARLGELLLVVSPLLIAQAINDWSFRGKQLMTVAMIGGFALIGLARFIYLYPELLSL